MTLRPCPRENELAALLHAGHWPHATSAEMRAHVAACASCRSLAALTLAFRSERALASAQPCLESPGVLWWRAQLRRRNAALARIGRPLLGAQIFAAALTLLAAGFFLATQLRPGASWFANLLTDPPRILHFAALLPAAWQDSPVAAFAVALFFAVLTLAGGVALYVASDK